MSDQDKDNGTGTQDPPVPTPNTPPPPPPKQDEPEAKFTQADLDARDAQATATAARATEKAVAEKLGVSVEEAVKLIAAQREAEDALKSDVEKQQEKATKALADAQALQAEANVEIVKAKLTTALLTGTDEAPGVAPERVEAALLLALPAALDSDQDDSIDAAVAFVRSTLPELFQGASDNDPSDDGKKGKVPPLPGRPASQGKQGTGSSNGDSETMSAFKKWKEKKTIAPFPGSQ